MVVPRVLTERRIIWWRDPCTYKGHYRSIDKSTLRSRNSLWKTCPLTWHWPSSYPTLRVSPKASHLSLLPLEKIRTNVENSSAKLAQLMIIPVAATRHLTDADHNSGVISIAASSSAVNAAHQQTSLRRQDFVLAGGIMAHISS
jgi:hypothetical protein